MVSFVFLDWWHGVGRKKGEKRICKDAGRCMVDMARKRCGLRAEVKPRTIKWLLSLPNTPLPRLLNVLHFLFIGFPPPVLRCLEANQSRRKQFAWVSSRTAVSRWLRRRTWKEDGGRTPLDYGVRKAGEALADRALVAPPSKNGDGIYFTGTVKNKRLIDPLLQK